MTGVWFTYRKDGFALRHSVRRFREVVENPKVAVVDELGATLSPEIVNEISPDHYEVSAWRRYGNLLGWTNALCELDAYSRISRKFGVAGVYKSDSDAMLMKTDWIDKDVGLCGFEASMWPTIHGGFGYWIRRDAAETILKSVSRQIFSRSRKRTNEDQTITYWALKHPEVSVIVHSWAYGRARGVHYRPDGEIVIDDALALSEALTFGNRHEMKRVRCPDERRRLVADGMERFGREVLGWRD